MTTVLDQFEVEYKECYISGSYDQIVMGKMFKQVTEFGIKKYIYSNRGVVYGSINSNQAQQPGTGIFDSNTSLSYRLQPYKEKSGNCRAAKFICQEERIYDTTLPNPLKCFNINGASVFATNNNPYSTPGQRKDYTGVDTFGSAFIMFDTYVPEDNIRFLPGGTETIWNGITGSINPGVDKHWTKTFPFEPRYSSIKREKYQNFSNIETKLIGSFFRDGFTSASFYYTNIPRKKSGLVIGTFGPQNIFRSNVTSGSYSPPISGNFYHRWGADVNLGSTVSLGGGFSTYVTGACNVEDTIKILFGFGDAITTFYDRSLISTSSITGYGRRGTNNWPEFRTNKITTVPPLGGAYIGYENYTGSIWCTSPVIRGWKYGIYNGLPDYTSMYYRQGRYGQYRDMLEQRIYTKTLLENKEELISRTQISDGPITVKFLDQNENITDPELTMSQNLSQFATSSLPYFDLQQRNRSNVPLMSNLTLIGFSIDDVGNVTI
jgi:hypothetical protein